MPVPSQNLICADSVVVSASDRLASQRCRENERALPVVARRLRTRTALVLEIIALRHQIAVLEHDRTRRPCLRPLDRLLWILLSHWWSGWRESLMIVQPETVLQAGAVMAGQRFGDSCGWNCPRWRCFTAQFKMTHYPLSVRRHGITLTPPITQILS